MEILSLFSVVIIFIIISITHTVLCADTCEPTSCSPTGPTVRFPFRLDGQATQCGYPGFDLSCNNQSQLILNLPLSGDVEVIDINYKTQNIYFKPEFCPLNRTQTDPSGTPFSFNSYMEYLFFNCTRNRFFPVDEPLIEVLDCLSGVNNTVVAVPSRFVSDQYSPESCQLTLVSPVAVGFVWGPPFCRRCELENGTCGYKNFEKLDIGCSVSSKTGLSAISRYGIIVGAGMPGLFLLICLAIYARKKINDHAIMQQRQHVLNLPIRTISPEPPRFVLGLDKLTIDSYPMTVLGASKRLPKPSDSTCAICLSEYQPNDTLRTVPECNHYFHSNCIDEWLKLNATCPVCRNLPDRSFGRAATRMSSSASLLSN